MQRARTNLLSLFSVTISVTRIPSHSVTSRNTRVRIKGAVMSSDVSRVIRWRRRGAISNS